jgi:hypothetical protein
VVIVPSFARCAMGRRDMANASAAICNITTY